MDIAEAIAHANCSAALSASPAHVAEALQMLAVRVYELEAERAEPIGIEWGVRWPDGSDRVCEDRVGAESLALYRRSAGAHVVQRDIYAPGPWRAAS